MKIIPITSSSNPLLKQVRGLQQRSLREKTGLFLVEGAKVFQEALQSRLKIQSVLVSQSFLKSGLGNAHDADIAQISVIDDREFAELVTTESACGIVAVVKRPEWKSQQLFNQQSLLVIADSIQDPGNLGTIIRTALAANASGVILTKGSVDAFNPKVVRAAAGALFHLPHLSGLTCHEAIALAKEKQLTVMSCSQQAAQPYWQSDLNQPVALIFGNEGQGFTDELVNLCDQSIAIPMSKNSESLNVSVAAGIILFGAVQQRQSKGR